MKNFLNEILALNYLAETDLNQINLKKTAACVLLLCIALILRDKRTSACLATQLPLWEHKRNIHNVKCHIGFYDEKVFLKGFNSNELDHEQDQPIKHSDWLQMSEFIIKDQSIFACIVMMKSTFMKTPIDSFVSKYAA